MSNKSFTNSMFESIKESLNNQKNSGGGYRDLLKTKVGNSYVVRLIPNIKNPERTFHHYYFHGWRSLSTGQYVDTVCPTTWGGKCPICVETFKLWRGSEEDKKKARELKRNEKWLVNVYVVDDPDNTDNNDTVKIFRYGKQIDSIFNEAIEGEDADEFGARIFDLSKEGCNLRIRVDENEGGYPSYIKSKFLSPSEIDGLTADKIKAIHNNLFELDKVFEVKTEEEVAEMLNDHFLCNPRSTKSAKNPPVNLGSNDEDDQDDQDDQGDQDDQDPVTEDNSDDEDQNEVDDNGVDSKLDELLDGLDS